MPGSSDRQIMLITTVDIGEGRTDQIQLREGDSPQVSQYMEVARLATKKHRSCIQGRMTNLLCLLSNCIMRATLRHADTPQSSHFRVVLLCRMRPWPSARIMDWTKALLGLWLATSKATWRGQIKTPLLRLVQLAPICDMNLPYGLRYVF